jgi:hypothetical protein
LGGPNENPPSYAIPTRQHNLACPTCTNPTIESKKLSGELSNRTGPPPESRSPAVEKDDGAPKEDDRLGGTIDRNNNQATPEKQECICSNCGSVFTPRKRSQKYCTPKCRLKAFRGSEAESVSSCVSPAPCVSSKLPCVPKNETQDFDWSEADDCIVLHHQPKTAIYRNPDNSIVIRQYNWPDEDSFVVITESNIDGFLDKLTEVCGIPSCGRPK